MSTKFIGNNKNLVKIVNLMLIEIKLDKKMPINRNLEGVRTMMKRIIVKNMCKKGRIKKKLSRKKKEARKSMFKKIVKL